MADVVSTQLTALIAGTRLNAIVDNGMLREACAVAAPAANQADTTFIYWGRVPSNARVSQVLISAADATTAGAIDVGLFTYDPVAGTYTAVDDDLFASAFDLSGGPFNNYDITFESGEYTYVEATKALWEVLGLSSDPRIDYIIGSDVTTTFNGGPTSMLLTWRYVI